MTSRAEVYKAVVEKLKEEGYSAGFQGDYSGRCMYGKTCPALSSNAPLSIITLRILEEAGMDNGASLVPVRSDDLGLDRIYY